MTYVLTVIWGLWTELSTSELIKWLLWKGLSHITVITICRIQASFFLLLYSYPGDDPVQYKWQWNLLYWCYMSTFNSVARSFATSFCKNCHRGLICSVLIYVFFICGQLSVGLNVETRHSSHCVDAERCFSVVFTFYSSLWLIFYRGHSYLSLPTKKYTLCFPNTTASRNEWFSFLLYLFLRPVWRAN